MIIVVLGLSILIGVSLGLLGGGGSILTVPILTYVGGMSAKAAIASSLFVVGVTSAAASVAHARAGRVRWRTGVIFGAAGMVGAYAGGQLAAFIPGRVLMIMFGLMMAATAVAMLRKPRAVEPPRTNDLPILKVIVEGIVVGIITGIVGAGGGFLVVPALVLLGGLSMPLAVGTSLVVISLKSFAGFVGHLEHVDIDWPITLGVTVAAVIGSIIGGNFVGRIPPAALRRGFGLFIIAMAALVLAKELL
ncbi:MAG TPA: sulfite exporter TauE/SafE family protein [Kofleriaceae bacterium]